MEEEGSKTKLIVGGIIVVFLLVGGFFAIRGFLSKKPVSKGTTTGFVTPTPFLQPIETITPSPVQDGLSGSQYYYYQSQGNSNSQNQSDQTQGNMHQSQSQTLPNGMTQSQSQ